jgi:GntR family transcriptional regulator, carbon starvation induced regulator
MYVTFRWRRVECQTIIDNMLASTVSIGRSALMEPIRSITEQVYVTLRSELVTCRLRPGEKLRTNELSKRFGVSLSAVREALARLTADGLAVADPQRGFTAAPISAADLSALTEAHIGIETLCLERSVVIGDAVWEGKLRQAFEKLASIKLPESEADGLSVEYAAAHAAFEAALVSACDNAWLLRLRTALTKQTQRYKQICIPAAAIRPDPTQIASEILNAALARDVEATVALVAKSFRINAARFIKVLDNAEAPITFRAHHSEKTSGRSQLA